MLAIDQTRPRAVVLLLMFMFAGHIVGVIWKNPPNSPTTRNSATVIAVGVIGIVGYLLAFGVHWSPATDGYGVP
jgi:hypothetical protein